MKKINLISKAEMKNILGGTAAVVADCTAKCPGKADVSCSGSSCSAIDGNGCGAVNGDTIDIKTCDGQTSTLA
ncbi:hypothetical protein EA772_01660 [Pedobacter sp. G11]|uniref:hypothetical protein n=1 Tax=Pedobacter sp. G11 TaxID=2482728 RepID=UPI000F5E497F|nr:hypothetical protein [Pedobacter sp. G11]AZI24111.1 hypothetical protein EA772_01660 [Pedobacter sp. G11]